jgi:protein-disulfide isomerase
VNALRNWVWIAILLLGVGGISASAAPRRRASTSIQLPKVTAAMIAAGKTFGVSTAPIRIDEYYDLECPHCQEFFLSTLRPLIDQYVANGKVYLVEHDFPLPMHTYAKQAAYLADAAAAIGKFEPVETSIFQHQDQWDMNGKVEPFVAAVLTPTQAKEVEALAQTSTVRDAVQADINQGNQLGIDQTPTSFITYKGHQTRIPGDVSYPVLRGYLDALLHQ